MYIDDLEIEDEGVADMLMGKFYSNEYFLQMRTPCKMLQDQVHLSQGQ